MTGLAATRAGDSGEAAFGGDALVRLRFACHSCEATPCRVLDRSPLQPHADAQIVKVGSPRRAREGASVPTQTHDSPAHPIVVAGLVPAIYELRSSSCCCVDARHKAGHDGYAEPASSEWI